MFKYVAYIWIMELCAYHFTSETVKAIFFRDMPAKYELQHKSSRFHIADLHLFQQKVSWVARPMT